MASFNIYKVDQALQYKLDKFYTVSEVLFIIYMGIYICKFLYICTNSPKCDLIVLKNAHNTVSCAQTTP